MAIPEIVYDFVAEAHMSSVTDGSSLEPEAVIEAINLLKQALSIIDKLNRPEIGARLQDVIELLGAINPSDD